MVDSFRKFLFKNIRENIDKEMTNVQIKVKTVENKRTHHLRMIEFIT